MTLDEIVFIVENKIKALEQQKNSAIMAGELELVGLIDAQIVETMITLNNLKKK